MSEWVLEVDENKNIPEAKWVQELVRCKDCIYYYDWCPYPVCTYHEYTVKETDFCSQGMRRDDVV